MIEIKQVDEQWWTDHSDIEGKVSFDTVPESSRHWLLKLFYAIKERYFTHRDRD